MREKKGVNTTQISFPLALENERCRSLRDAEERYKVTEQGFISHLQKAVMGETRTQPREQSG